MPNKARPPRIVPRSLELAKKLYPKGGFRGSRLPKMGGKYPGGALYDAAVEAYRNKNYKLARDRLNQATSLFETSVRETEVEISKLPSGIRERKRLEKALERAQKNYASSILRLSNQLPAV